MKDTHYIDSQGDTWQSESEYKLHLEMYSKQKNQKEVKTKVLNHYQEGCKIRRIQKQLERRYTNTCKKKT